MFRIEASGQTRTYCDGMSRRSFLQLGVAGMASLSLADVLRTKAASEALGHEKKDTSVILVWLDGGPSHMDLWDMKPDAPSEYSGLWRPIRTNVRGIEISEMLPHQAKVADKFTIVRSLCNNMTHHEPASRFMLTGHTDALSDGRSAKYPSIGSIATKVCGPRQEGVPPYVSVPVASTIGRNPGYLGASYLGGQHNPFQTGGDPNLADFQIKNITAPPGMSIQRLEDREGLRRKFDKWHRDLDETHAFDAMDQFDQQAFELTAGSAARKAFDLSLENPSVRDRYGRHTWGQSALLARRLVEAGSTFVTVHCGGWDHHWNLEAGLIDYLPKIDTTVSALYEDLDDRGLLDQVLVVVGGEFGRTPYMNNGHGKGKPGRDHWGKVFSCLMGGAGVQGGKILGASDDRGEFVADRPVSPGDFQATIYHVLGVDPEISTTDLTGRPVLSAVNGTVIRELF